AARLGRRVALVERRRVVGGVCIDTGTIPSKTFREAVLSFASRPLRQPSGAGFGAGPGASPGGAAPGGNGGRPSAAGLLSPVAAVVRRPAGLARAPPAPTSRSTAARPAPSTRTPSRSPRSSAPAR